jgi:hypothetical protein
MDRYLQDQAFCVPVENVTFSVCVEDEELFKSCAMKTGRN